MKIIVCMKQVPAGTNVEIDPETGAMKRMSGETRTNPYDLFALETALLLKEKMGGTVTVLTMGPAQAEEMMRDAYTMGADEAVILSDRKFAGADVLATSYALKQGIEVIGGADLILCGRQTTDGDTAQVGPAIAEHMGIPHAAWVSEIVNVREDAICVKQDLASVTQVSELPFPCLITVDKDICVPRLPSYRLMRETEERPVRILSFKDMPDQDLSRYGLIGSPTAVERMFITGVSPVTMDDVTSGFNIGTDISLSPAFNAILGFSEEEVRTMIGYYQAEGVLPPGIAADRLLDEMRPWYDNYCFSEESLDEHVFNSDMVLYCLNSYLLQKKPPRQMVDNNIRTDYNKLRQLIRIDKKLGENASVLQDVIAQGSTTAELVTSFPAERMADPKNFKSLLYYLGLLAIRDVDFGRTVLNVPNLTVREQLYNHLVEIYREASLFSLDLSKLSDLVKDMALHGAWQPVFRYFAAELERQSAVREFIEGEAHVKGFLLAYLGLTKGYVILPEHESAKGYADFYMMPDLVRQPTVAYSYLVEVKYARREASSSELAALKADAAQQLQRYAEDEKVQRSKGNTQLTLITLIFKGWELVEAEAL